MKLENNLATDTTWDIHETRYVPEQVVTTGSNYMIGNGYLGYRGTFADDRADQYVACVLTDTYDNADGKWKELVTAPNGLFTELSVDGKPCRWRDADAGYKRMLNFRYGEWSVTGEWSEAGVSATEERFASYNDLHLVTARTRITAHRAVRLEVHTGIDGTVWSLNGDHFSELVVAGVDAESAGTGGVPMLEARAVTGEHGYDVVVREASCIVGAGDVLYDETETREIPEERVLQRVYTIDLAPEESVTLLKYVGLASSNDLRAPQTVSTDAARGPAPPKEQVRKAAGDTVLRAWEQSWEDLRDAHRGIWDERWRMLDIRITGDEIAQTVLRYNMYHNVIATPAHADHLPIGARGLSCQAYQGAAFWDQEIFNLPMFLFTDPDTARSILVYRYRTLDGARRKARDLGYRGAFYAWVSGDTGEEICPSYFFKDVLSGRRIRNHFNDWQIHISPDIAYTVAKYMDVTGDEAFLTRYGAEIVFEIGRFLASRVHYRLDRACYEVIRVLGPDEYHENVDNNFFTNYQVRFTLRYAHQIHEWMAEHAPETLRTLSDAIGLSREEADQWSDIADRIYVPAPDPETSLIEQFDGFFALEDTTPDTIRERLLDPGEYWGWPNGIALETQVSKQADVTQLFVLHPGAYSREVMRANWEYYEPRTQHGSSLSYAVYAMSAAWLGHMEEAYRYFLRSCTVDLYNTGKSISGGTFIGGIHTAACGIAWQIVVNGFLGMETTSGGFRFAPNLPESWREMRVPLQWRGALVAVSADGERLTVEASDDNTRVVSIAVGAEEQELPPGETVTFSFTR